MRDIPVVDRVSAEVEGDIAEIEGVLRITQIRLKYRIVAPEGSGEKIDRALESYADRCPAYQSVKGCIDCVWEIEIVPE